MFKKNKELCELLGIKPKKCIKDEYDEICSKYDECENAPACVTYPDLTKPSNFVKLFQIYFDTHFEIWTDSKAQGVPDYFKKYEKSVQEWLINHLLFCYHPNQTVPPEYGNQYETWKKLLKLTAQKINWNY